MKKINAFALIAATLLAQSSRAEDAPPFKQAIDPITFVFPADHASHAGFQTEWWYVTGNLSDEKGREFGFQFTIFRRAMDPKDAQARGRTSAWAAEDCYLLHLAISDIGGNSHADYEALERGVLGIAGATDVSALLKARPEGAMASEHKIPENVLEPYARVWTKDASFDRYKQGWKLKALSPRIGFDLTLNDPAGRTNPEILHGKSQEAGLSRKGPHPGQASYYYSVPRLATSGTLTLDGKQFNVTGLSWMDHEFGSNQLSADQAGWEWFSIQLNNQEEIMLYVLRNKDGSIEPSSSGTWVDSAGRPEHFNVEPSMFVRGHSWKSPHSGKKYTLEWTIKTPLGEYRIKPAMDNQEFHSDESGGMHYYEGAIDVEGTNRGGAPVTGKGYLEITGNGLGGRL